MFHEVCNVPPRLNYKEKNKVQIAAVTFLTQKRDTLAESGCSGALAAVTMFEQYAHIDVYIVIM